MRGSHRSPAVCGVLPALWKLKPAVLRSAEHWWRWKSSGSRTVAARGLYSLAETDRPKSLLFAAGYCIRRCMDMASALAPKRAKRCRFAVNISPLQFRRPEFIETCSPLLEAHGFTAGIAGAGSDGRACCFPVSIRRSPWLESLRDLEFQWLLMMWYWAFQPEATGVSLPITKVKAGPQFYHRCSQPMVWRSAAIVQG